MISNHQILILALACLFMLSLFTSLLTLAQTSTPDPTPTPSPAPTPTMLWQFTPRNYVGPGNYSIWGWSTPAIVDGVVYVEMYGQRSYQKVVPHHYLPMNETITMNEGWGGVFALNATTGEIVWFVTTKGGSVLSPSVGDGKVFAQISEGKIGAFSSSNGQILWTFTTKASTSEYYDFSAKVAAVSEGIVFIGAKDGKVYALNASDGSTLWAFAGSPTSIDNTQYSTPTVVDGVVYVCSNQGALYALDAVSGYTLWSRDTNASIPMIPIGNDDLVVYYSPYDPDIHALNAENGDEIWNFTTGTVISVPVVSNNVVYLKTGFWEKGDTFVRDNVYALNSNNGAVLWNNTLGEFDGGSLTVVNGVVYVGSLDNTLYALNAGSGQMIWSYTVGAAIFPTPAVVNGLVCFSSTDGVLYALKAPMLVPSQSPSPPTSIKLQNQLLVVALVVLGVTTVVSLLLFGRHRKNLKNR
jgi:outer membrane protein assembly factor BamB